MKISNILLLTLAVIPVLFAAAIPITFHWKLKHGNYTVINPEENFDYNQYKFTEINSIALSGIDCVILPSDSVKIDVEKERANLIEVIQQNKTLMISLKQKGPSPKIRLYLPSLEKFTANNSSILLRGQLKQTDLKSYSFQMTNTSLRTSNISVEERINQFINSIDINGSNSIVDLSGTVQIKKMSITDIENVKRSPRVNIGEMEFVYNKKDEVKSVGKDGVVQVLVK